MRSLLLIASLFATAASAQTTRLIGFVTVDGHHPGLSCASHEGPVAELKLTRGDRSIVVPITCEAAPAVAFSVSVPEGTWQISVSGGQLASAPRRVVVTGSRQLVTLDAHRASASRTVASAARRRTSA